MSDKDPKSVLSAVVKESGIDIYRKINTACLIVIAAVCITSALIYTKSILVPLVISIFIFTMITPIIRYIKYKFRFPKWLAVITASILVMVPLVLMVFFMVNSVGNFVQIAGTYQSKVIDMFNWFVNYIHSNKIPIPEDMLDFNNLKALLTGPSATNLIKGSAGGAVKIVSYATLVFIFVFFLLIGSGSTRITNTLLKEIQNKISAYLYIHIVMSLITGICVGIVYFSCGLELAMMFAVLTVILNFIPNVGSVVAVLLPVPIALMQFGPGAVFLVILIIPACLQFFIGSIVEPKLLGSGMDLHPVTIIGSLVFWALVWGIPGAFLAVPITAAVRIILSKLEPTRPFAEIMSGRLPK